MPLLDSSYRPPFYLRSSHLQTVYPTLCRRVATPGYVRERLELADGDFIDIDHLPNPGSSKFAILSHGLEGSSNSKYVISLGRLLHRRGWHIAAWNFRGCSGETNRLLPWYHSGRSDDLKRVVEHIRKKHAPETVALVGVSVGGNITLKYLGEEGSSLPSCIKSAVTISVPLDLEECALIMARPKNRIYMEWFLRLMRKRVRDKMALYPSRISDDGIMKIRTFLEFDSRYTAPLNGFSSAKEYWRASSSLPLLESVRTPTLLLNATDDPFLGPRCIPSASAERSPYLFLERSRYGGHVGFLPHRQGAPYWNESRAVEFIETMGIHTS